ncbi:spermatogenesis-associated protein 2-like [Hypanus sabinus]|uniref:spermatogenesis-associated protein 2-like n=1 Tax=Hypanus sabinus TaxID=79690 RepID=UPI0028C480A6|nr:spermatogenesis-associated protein 2-like [Hypanus sabinus]
METQKGSLCQRYIHFQELKSNAGSEATLEETTMCVLGTELLKGQDPTQRFNIHFYQVISNAFSRENSSSFDLLQKAFEVFESLCINLLIYPWRKEFKRIKTFTPAFVHYVWTAMCRLDVLKLLATIGFCQEQEAETYCYKDPQQMQHLKKLAFEFFLAQLECRRLADMLGNGRKQGPSEDGMGCLCLLGEGQKELLILKHNCRVNLGKLSVREGYILEKHWPHTSLLTYLLNRENEEGKTTISFLPNELNSACNAVSCDSLI